MATATATLDPSGLADLVPGLEELVEALREETAADNDIVTQVEARMGARGNEDKAGAILGRIQDAIKLRLVQERAEIDRKEGVLRRFGMDPQASREAGRPVAASGDAPAAKQAPKKAPQAEKKAKLTKDDVLGFLPAKGAVAGADLIKKVNEGGFKDAQGEEVYGLLFDLTSDGLVTSEAAAKGGGRVFRRA